MSRVISIQRSRTCGCLRQGAATCLTEWSSQMHGLPGSASQLCHMRAAGCGKVIYPWCVVLCSCSVTAALQASLSFTISWSLLELMSIESVMPSNPLVLLSPSPPAFSLSQCCAVLIHKQELEWCFTHKAVMSIKWANTALSPNLWVPVSILRFKQPKIQPSNTKGWL